MEQYRMCELSFQGKVLQDAWAQIPMQAALECGDIRLTVPGFYAGNGVYKVRFLPEKPGRWNYKISGCIEEEGAVEIAPAGESHGIMKAHKCHFEYQDGTYFYPFGTTVYALMHQEDSLVEETMKSLKNGPFNKVRFCVFPKHYDFNHNEPPCYAFEKKEDGGWNVNRPCPEFWDRLDKIILGLDKMKIQADLILFHPYDRWGFSSLPQEDNLIYLDYLLRRLSAMPNVWWSLANEYDLCAAKTLEQWEEIESFVAERDAFHHLLSNHNCFAFWDFSRPAVTHVSVQTKMLTRVSEWRKKYQKPVVVDECCYEGNIQHYWGSISGKEMTNRFWRVVTSGGYCTHGETYLEDGNDILWWSRGGSLKGESPKRIAFLRKIVEELPGPIEPVDMLIAKVVGAGEAEWEEVQKEIPEPAMVFAKAMRRMGQDGPWFMGSEYEYQGHCGEDAYLTFYDLRTCAKSVLDLPKEHAYRVELIDTWEMTRETLVEKACGKTEISLPAREGMAVLAVKVE
ncbi:MAG: DUF4038 domain-containing protein [Clostridium sp.]|nr:DUF4038 domain-containing protein [Clostridium sp.]